ncbi:MAG: NAD-dependent epimerase/dehydratase family protein [Panacagrimonas sp.]
MSAASAETGVATSASGFFHGKNVLVVGASGFLGRSLTQRLLALGANVYAVSRGIDPVAGVARLNTLRADASLPPDVERVFGLARPAVVFHLTSDSRGGRELEIVPSSLSNDVVATVNLLYGAAKASSSVERFVMTASLEEPAAGEPNAAVPVSPYAAAKWASGAYGRMFRALYNLDVRIVRPMMTYGPGQKDYKLIPSIVRSLLADRPARVNSAAREVDWIYVEDTVAGMLAAACVSTLDRTIDLGSGRLVTVGEVVGEIARQLNKLHLLERSEPVRGAEIVRVADVETARCRIGFEAAVSLQEGLARTLAFYRASTPP